MNQKELKQPCPQQYLMVNTFESKNIVDMTAFFCEEIETYNYIGGNTNF